MTKFLSLIGTAIPIMPIIHLTVTNQTVDAKFNTKKALEMLDYALSKSEMPLQISN
jgi:hypothetical protein